VTFKEKFTSNIGWKITGILLALALWFHLATEKNYEKSFSAEIEFVGLAQNMAVDFFQPETADLVIEGTGKELISLAFSDDFTIRIDLSHITEPGIYDQKFSPTDIFPTDHYKSNNFSFPSGDICSISIKYKI
jgi:YbbR domain-containing protein